MLVPSKPEVSEKKLLLGDYMTVHVAGLKTSDVNGGKQIDMQVCRESFIQRALKERGELLQRSPEQGGTLIDVRQSGAA